MTPRYPIYVISKGRHERCLTAKFLTKEGVPFKLVVELQEADLYRARFGASVVVLPFKNLGLGSIPARNWCWEDSLAAGAERHWILDDNIRHFERVYKGRRVPCESAPAFAVCEDFTDRYTNIGISGFNYDKFVTYKVKKPFVSNCHVYSSLLIRNDLPYRWRGRYNEDTVFCLQCLSGGWATILLNCFTIRKIRTMTMKGGNSAELYQGDGRLRMARSLERQWPGVVKVKRRFGRPQHVVDWKRFRFPLIKKPPEDLPPQRDYKLQLVPRGEVKDRRLKKLLTTWNKEGKP